MLPSRRRGISCRICRCFAAVLHEPRPSPSKMDQWKGATRHLFRSFSNILNGVCDDAVCKENLQRDMVALGSDVVLWMDHADRGKETTTLEFLARSIFDFHCGDVPDCGGEWWVQYRPTKHLPAAGNDQPFHWDKDEVQNAKERYKGPYLTCVTYLNDATFPTLALGKHKQKAGLG